MRFRPFPADWARRETYEHYVRNPCSYAVTRRVDLSSLRGKRFAPAMIHALCRTVARFPELRMADRDGPGYWEAVCPTYTVFHPRTETFSVLWTEFDPDPAVFAERYAADVARYGDQSAFFPKGPPPAWALNVSIVPWFDFTAFSLDYGLDYLMPVFTVGRAVEEVDGWWAPLSVQANHAACDGWHLARFFDELDAELAGGPG